MSDQPAVTVEPALPERVTDERDPAVSDLVLARRERPPDRGFDSQRLEQVCGNAGGIQLLWFPAGERCASQVEGRNVLEGLSVLPPPCVMPGVDGQGGVFIGYGGDDFLYCDQPIRVRKGQWLEQDAVDHRKDGRIRSDAQRDGQNSCSGEPRFTRQRTRGEHKVFEGGHSGSME